MNLRKPRSPNQQDFLNQRLVSRSIVFRLYRVFKRHLKRCFDPEASIPKSIPKDQIADFYLELERAMKNPHK